METVFGELFSLVGHTDLYKNKVSKTLFSVNRIGTQMNKVIRNLFPDNDLQRYVKI